MTIYITVTGEQTSVKQLDDVLAAKLVFAAEKSGMDKTVLVLAILKDWFDKEDQQ